MILITWLEPSSCRKDSAPILAFLETYGRSTFTNHLRALRSFRLRGAQMPYKRLPQQVRVAAKYIFSNRARVQTRPNKLQNASPTSSVRKLLHLNSNNRCTAFRAP